jgi:hypothetical protein
VERVASAVLYEGYLLYPYRPSSVKNQQRWTFGGVVPQAYSEAQRGSDPWAVQTECLASGGAGSTLEVRVRFLQLQERRDASGQAWQEAVERDIPAPPFFLGELVKEPQRLDFAFPAWEKTESDRDSKGTIVRRREPLESQVEISAAAVQEDLFRVTVRVRNLTSLPDAERKTRDEAMLHALVSTHTILHVHDGAFLSLIDPPEHARAAAAQCRNEGAWPVLVGEPGATDAMLSAPIILYDYPQTAPESPGDLFDATEIDEILTLRILTLTPEEKQEMCAADDRARALLERTEGLNAEQLMKLHGAVRSLRPVPGGQPHV